MEQSHVQIRYTQDEDSDHLRQWFDDDNTIRWFHTAKTKKDIEYAVSYWIAFAKQKCSLTATIDGEVCGIATLFMEPYAKVAHRSEIGIIVAEKWRNKGIGTKLLNNLFFLAKNRFDLEFLHLQVFEGSPAISLYKRFGFQEFGRAANWIKEEDGNYLSGIFMSSETSEDKINSHHVELV